MFKKISLKFAGLMAFVFVFGLASSPVLATSQFIPGSGENLTALAPASETYKNLYVAGADVLVNSTVTGDLYTAGGDVTVDGNVEQDLTALAGAITLSSPIGGDLRVAGGTVVVNSTVGGDVVVLGGNVIFSDKASILGDLVARGGTITLEAPVNGKVDIASEKVTINSVLNGQVSIWASEEFNIGSKTEITQSINYKGTKEAIVADGAKVNQVNYERIEHSGRNKDISGAIIGAWLISLILKLVAFALAIFVLLKLFTKTSHQAANTLRAGFWKNLGIGFIAVIATPVLALVLLISGVGLFLALLLFFGYVLLLILSLLLTILFTGAETLRRISGKLHLDLDWKAIVLGVILFAILSFIPVVGWLVIPLLIMASFGALLSLIYNSIHNNQAEPHVNVIENNN